MENASPGASVATSMSDESAMPFGEISGDPAVAERHQP